MDEIFAHLTVLIDAAGPAKYDPRLDANQESIRLLGYSLTELSTVIAFAKSKGYDAAGPGKPTVPVADMEKRVDYLIKAARELERSDGRESASADLDIARKRVLAPHRPPPQEQKTEGGTTK